MRGPSNGVGDDGQRPVPDPRRTVDGAPDRRAAAAGGGRRGAAAARGTGATGRCRARRRAAPRRRRRRRCGGSGGGGRGGGGAAARWQTGHRRLRIRLHASRSRQPEHRLGVVLRQRSHAMGRAHRPRAIGQPVDPHARLRAEQGEVSLPLDAAARDRSVRSRHASTTAARSSSRRATQGQTWKVISPDLSTQDPTHIVSSGGIVGDNLGQFYGEVVFAIAPSPIQKGLHLGRHERRQALVHEGRRRRNWTDVTKNITGLPALGHGHADLAVELRPGHGVRRGRLAPDGRPQAVPLQDDGLRRDVDEDQRRPADRASARLREVGRGKPEQEGHALRRHRPRLLLLDGRRRARGRSSRKVCRRRPSPGSPSRSATTTSSSRPTAAGLYILPNITLLEETGQTPAAPPTTKLYRAASGDSSGAQRAGGLRVLARQRAGRADQDGDSRRRRDGREEAADLPRMPDSTPRAGICATTARRPSSCARRRPRIRTSGTRRGSRTRRCGRWTTGASRAPSARRRSPRRASTRCA